MTSAKTFISFFSIIFSILVFFSLVAPSISSPTEKLSPETVKRICAATSYPRLCFRTLRHDPRTQTLPLNHLTLSYVEKTRGKAQSIMFLLEKLSALTNDTELKSRYSGCNYHYNQALTDLTRAKRRLNSGIYTGISGLAMKAVVGPSECDDEFDDKKYGRPAEIVDSNVEFATLGGIVFALAAELVLG